jgi:uncharacterized protein YkwD
MICGARRSVRLSLTLKTIPEDASVSFMNRSDIAALPGLLEREFEHGDHRIVNRSRATRQVEPLRRSSYLDCLAETHAKVMAEQESVFHSVDSVEALQKKLHGQQVGENILRGKSLLQMHKDIMTGSDSFLRRNILSTKFHEMGMGMANGNDGHVYLVQLFRSTEDANW